MWLLLQMHTALPQTLKFERLLLQKCTQRYRWHWPPRRCWIEDEAAAAAYGRSAVADDDAQDAVAAADVQTALSLSLKTKIKPKLLLVARSWRRSAAAAEEADTQWPLSLNRWALVLMLKRRRSSCRWRRRHVTGVDIADAAAAAAQAKVKSASAAQKTQVACCRCLRLHRRNKPQMLRWRLKAAPQLITKLLRRCWRWNFDANPSCCC